MFPVSEPVFLFSAVVGIGLTMVEVMHPWMERRADALEAGKSVDVEKKETKPHAHGKSLS
jgi:hypothetical protein